MWTPTGNQFYCAPEIYTKVSYNYKIDMWASGVMISTIIVGYFILIID